MNSGRGDRNKVVPIGADASIRYLLKPFEKALAHPDVTEICVNRPGEMFVEAAGSWHYREVPELTVESLKSLGVAVAAHSRNDLSETRPILSAVLPDSERIQFVLPPACEAGTVSVTIRKPSHQVRTLAEYEKQGFFSHVRPMAEGLTEQEQRLIDLKDGGDYITFLREAVRLGLNIVIAGETGSGKTTFMKALMQEIPQQERIITIEDVPELFLPNHPNHVHLFYPSEAGAGSGQAVVTSASLLRSCLRMKPDRILLAELRGAETFDFINVCASGHGGSITSCHAGSADLTFERLALMVMENEKGRQLPHEVIQKLLYLVVDVVLHVHNSGGAAGRHITELWYEPMRKRESKSDSGIVAALKEVIDFHETAFWKTHLATLKQSSRLDECEAALGIQRS